MKRWFSFLLIICLMLPLCACGNEEVPVTQPSESETDATSVPTHGKMMILFTGGLNGVFAQDQTLGQIGYAAAFEFYQQQENEFEYAALVDGGNSITSSDDALWDVVEACGYEIRVPGFWELENGMSVFLQRSRDMKDGVYLSCNLMDLSRDEPILDPYVIVDAGDVKIGFVGVTAPKALTRADSQKYELLGATNAQELYEAVQQAVDDAASDGADYVVVVGNLGTDPADSPCTTVDVIANITGLAGWLDCGSGAVLEGTTVTDKDDFEIPICAPGSDFRYVGQIIVDLNTGETTVQLLTGLVEENRTVKKLVDEIVVE